MSEQTELYVRLSPKASRNKINGWGTDQDGRKILKISVTAPPENGKANRALINLLAKSLKLPKSGINLAKGETNRNKLLVLNGISSQTLDAFIRQIQEKS